MQLSSLQDAEPIGASYVAIEIKEADLNLPFELFAKIYFEPALAQLKQFHEDLKVKP